MWKLLGCTLCHVLSVWPMMWMRPEARTSELEVLQVFILAVVNTNWTAQNPRELLPSIDEYNEWSFCAIVTFSSHTSWNLGAKTSRKSVHRKVCFTHVFWPNSVQFLHEASFGLRVLSLPASVCVCLSVCPSVCQSLACRRDNSRPVQARIA